MDSFEKKTIRRNVTIWDHLTLILKWKKLFLIFMTIMAVSSITYVFLAKKWYQSDGQVLPPPPSTMELGNLVPNLDMGILKGVGALPNETKLILTVLDSRLLKDLVIDHFNWFKRHKLATRYKAYELYIDLISWQTTESGSIQVFVIEDDPEIAANTVNFILATISEEYNRISAAQARNQRVFFENRLNEIKEELADIEENFQQFMEKTGVISVKDQLTATVESVAKLKTEAILAEVQLEVLESTMPQDASLVVQARETVKALNSQLENVMRQSESELPNMIMSMDVAPDYSIQYLRLEREIMLRSKILEYLLPQFEQARITERREQGNLFILDKGEIPEKKCRPQRALIFAAWMFLSFVLLYLYVLFVEWLHALQEKDPQFYQLVHGVLVGWKPRNLFGRSKSLQQ